MKLNRHILFLAICLFEVGSAVASEPKFTPIFDGKSLQGWSGDTRYWRVDDGAVTGEIPRGETLRSNQFLFYAHDIHDFELAL
jgi:hypothetical protein